MRMSETATTHYSSMCEILGELWLDYRVDDKFQDFVSYNDLGLPLAYCIVNGIVPSTSIAENYVKETFAIFLAALDIEDVGFDSLNSMLEAADGFDTELAI
jgi:hypothetical protein